MIIIASEAFLSGVNSQEDQLEAMPALTINSSSSERTVSATMSVMEPFVVRLGVGPRWWS